MSLQSAAMAYGLALAELEVLNNKHATLPERIFASNKVMAASQALKDAAKEYFEQHRLAA